MGHPLVYSTIWSIYRCTVVDVDDAACQESGLDVLQDMEGYISGAEMLLAQCVLAFNMSPGQRLNVTVLDFTANSTTTTGGENMQLQPTDGCPSSQVGLRRVSSSNPVRDQLSSGRASTPTTVGADSMAATGAVAPPRPEKVVGAMPLSRSRPSGIL